MLNYPISNIVIATISMAFSDFGVSLAFCTVTLPGLERPTDGCDGQVTFVHIK